MTDDNSEMPTPIINTAIPPELLADGEAVIEAITSGQPLDPEIVRRVDERAARITAEIQQRHGTLDVVIPAIRELRDQ